MNLTQSSEIGVTERTVGKARSRGMRRQNCNFWQNGGKEWSVGKVNATGF